MSEEKPESRNADAEPKQPADKTQSANAAAEDSGEKESVDWRVIVIIGVAALLLLAVYVNRKIYNKKPAPTADNQPAANAQQEAAAPVTPENFYQTMRVDRAVGIMESYFAEDGRSLLLARLPILTEPSEPNGIPGCEPGLWFDVTQRLPGYEITDFQRRTYMSSPAFMDSFPTIGVAGSPKLTITAAADVPATIMGDQSPVIGIVVGDEARAYPAWFMNFHDVINDTLGGKDILVTWSATAMAGMAFYRPAAGDHSEIFGSSGLIFQSANVFYDSATLSLWSPTFEKCIAGKLLGTTLQPIQSELTSWTVWKKLHPTTTVTMGTDPRLRIQYNMNPAMPADYYQSPMIMYPVKGFKFDGPLPAKAALIGVLTPDGHAKAYVRALLRETKGEFQDTIGGQKVTLVFDPATDILTVKLEDGKELMTENMIWIGWVGAHPDTEIWNIERVNAIMQASPAGTDTGAVSKPLAPYAPPAPAPAPASGSAPEPAPAPAPSSASTPEPAPAK